MMPPAYVDYRRAILPHQLAAARATVVHLENEARLLAYQPRHADVVPLAAQAKEIADSDTVLGVFAAPEWDELADDGKDWVTAIVRETLERSVAPILLEALYALIGVEPSNSDDPNDPEQCAAWRQAHDAIGIAIASPNLLIVPASSPLGRNGAAAPAPSAAAPTLSLAPQEGR
jgi:hypothetical protein